MPATQKLLAAIAVIVALAVPAGLLTAHGQNHVLAPEVGGARYRVVAADADRDGARRLPANVEAATFTFAPGTDAISRQAVLRAVADASPAARRLIDLVDGLVTVRVGPTGASGRDRPDRAARPRLLT